MADNKNEITYFAETDFRNKKTPFGIKLSDRARHMYIIGKTGMGKSTLLENLAVQDIKNGNGLAFVDPHGKSAELLLDYVPKERIKDVIYFAPHDVDYPISFNVMEDVGKDQRHLIANGLMASFKKIWPDVWSARMEYISMNIILALLEYPDSTLLGINRMLSDKDYRKKVVDNITDPSVRSFWVNEFAKYSDKIMVEAGASIQNKFGQFSSNPLIRNIIGQSKSSFNLRDVMDNRKIFIANLSKGRMGEINTNLIGGMLITKIYLAAMSRANVSDSDLKKLPNFYVYVDEFQSFVNDSFADILSEARKYKLNLTIAHQYIEQMPETVRNAVFGNVGTTIAFRVGPFDAEVLEKIFAPKFTAEDIVNLGFAQIYLTLMIDGVGSQPFSAKTLPPIALPEEKFTADIIDNSRKTFAKPREEVETEIKKWHESDQYKDVKSFDKLAVRGELENIKKDYGIKEFPPKKAASFERPASRVGLPVGKETGWQERSKRVEPPTRAPAQFSQSPRSISSAPNVPASISYTKSQSFAAPLHKYIEKDFQTRKTVQDVSQIKSVITPPASIHGEPKKISLDELKRSEPKRDDKAQGKNIGELKNILSQAIASKGKGFAVGKVEAKKDKSVPEEREKIIEQIPDKDMIPNVQEQNKKNISEENKIKEVPEEVLRKVLNTEEQK